ncbi:MAG: helix-turn-helix transcriptional regulator [Acidimicrobiales bacterium]|jgi:DNA-binding HxlR family transcriptional regulator|nr:helix-turn-helix transcriptional regulator [Acidimicrobiales bacterium]
MARRSYEQFCPVSRALDLLGERWTLLIVRELLTGPKRYTDLREHLPGMWNNLLGQRLRELEAAGIVHRRDLPPPAARTVYELTERGRELEPVVYELARWGVGLLDLPTPDQPLLPHLLPLGERSLVAIEHLPDDGIVVHLDLHAGEHDGDLRSTLVVDPVADPPVRALGRVHVEPGLVGTPDAVVTGSLAWLLWFRQGAVSWQEATGEGALVVRPRRAGPRLRPLFTPDPVTASPHRRLGPARDAT